MIPLGAVLLRIRKESLGYHYLDDTLDVSVSAGMSVELSVMKLNLFCIDCMEAPIVAQAISHL